MSTFYDRVRERAYYLSRQATPEAFWEQALREQAIAESISYSTDGTINGLIRELESIDQDLPLDSSFYGSTCGSYRGSYKHLAIGSGYEDGDPNKWDDNGDFIINHRPYFPQALSSNPTVGDLVTMLKQSIGHTFSGYKGGDFEMDGDCYVYLSSWGYCGEDDRPVKGFRVINGIVEF